MTEAPVEVVPHDPSWPALYDAEAERIRAAMGPALRVLEHVGSTAVPGLDAKPILDVMAAVDDLRNVGPALPALAGLGYRPAETGMRERLFLWRPPGANGVGGHLHVVTLASWPGRKERRFRDRLLARPEEAAAYGALKRELAGRFRHDRDGYTRAKTALIQAIMDRAADEAGLPREGVWEN